AIGGQATRYAEHAADLEHGQTRGMAPPRPDDATEPRIAVERIAIVAVVAVGHADVAGHDLAALVDDVGDALARLEPDAARAERRHVAHDELDVERGLPGQPAHARGIIGEHDARGPSL